MAKVTHNEVTGVTRITLFDEFAGYATYVNPGPGGWYLIEASDKDGVRAKDTAALDAIHDLYWEMVGARDEATRAIGVVQELERALEEA